jgi:hypothetical protein
MASYCYHAEIQPTEPPHPPPGICRALCEREGSYLDFQYRGLLAGNHYPCDCSIAQAQGNSLRSGSVSLTRQRSCNIRYRSCSRPAGTLFKFQKDILRFLSTPSSRHSHRFLSDAQKQQFNKLVLSVGM